MKSERDHGHVQVYLEPSLKAVYTHYFKPPDFTGWTKSKYSENVNKVHSLISEPLTVNRVWAIRKDYLMLGTEFIGK
jgi:hypothetical protein